MEGVATIRSLSDNRTSSNIDWIDSIKGIAIIWVILLHTGFGRTDIGMWFHIQQAVPLFLFCSSYLLGNRSIKGYYSKSRIKKLFRRIWKPFIFFQVIALLLLIFRCVFSHKEIMQTLILFIKGGGYGPGSYYPWVYVQYWALIPLVKYIVDKIPNLFMSLLINVIICGVLEYLFVVIISSNFDYQNSVYIWRLLAIRYIMYIWIGICFNRIIKFPLFWIILVLTSIFLAYRDIYFSNITPSYEFDGFHFFTAFYIIPVVLLLRFVNWGGVRLIGRYSYEIFLVQMIILPFTPNLKFIFSGYTLIILNLLFKYLIISLVSYFYIRYKYYSQNQNMKLLNK